MTLPVPPRSAYALSATATSATPTPPWRSMWPKPTAADAPMVVLSTASPFKFPRDVLAALGETAPESDFAAMAALTAKTGAVAPCPACVNWINCRYASTPSSSLPRSAPQPCAEPTAIL